MTAVRLFKFLVLACSFSINAFAVESLSYSGRLVNANGSPVTGPVNLQFNLSYTDDPSDVICSKTLTGVTLTKGVFHTKLDFAPADCGGTLTITQVLAAVPANESIAIQVKDLTNNKDYSYQAIHSIPTSLVAKTATVAKNLERMGATNGQVLTWNGTTWAPAAAAGGGGTVTQVSTGTGLNPVTINASNPTGVISVAPGGISTSEIANGSITNIDLSNTAAIARTKLANGTASSIVINNASGVMTDTTILPLTMGGTGANTDSGARANLGLGTAAVANVGAGAGNVLPADGITSCLSTEKLQITLLPVIAWTCVADNATDSTKLPIDGSVAMTGNLNMGSRRIVSLAAPTAGTDATTRDYVDNLVGNNSHWTLSSGNVYRATGRVGLGTATPDAALDISSTTSGILIPRMTTAQRTAINPATAANKGMQVYDTDTNEIWYIKNNVWTALGAAGTGVTAITSSTGFASPAASQTGAVSLAINVGTGNNQIVQLDGSARLPGVDGSQLTGLTQTQVSGIVPVSKGGTNLTALGTANQVLGVNNAAGAMEYKSIVGGTNVGVVHTANTITLNVAGSAPTGAAGGDLSGTYPNPTISGLDAAKINTGVVSNTEFNYLDGVTSAIQTQLNAKEGTIAAGTTAQYWRGDKSWQTLDTSEVPEDGNLYFTQARVLSTPLTGLGAGSNAAIAATDTFLAALAKLQAQITATASGTNGSFVDGGNTFTGTATLGTNSAHALALETGGTTKMTILADGKVGIGTTSPQEVLNVNGNLRLGPGGDADADYTIKTGGQLTIHADDSTSNGSYVGLQLAAGAAASGQGIITIATGGSERLRVSETGNIGIGTTAPAATLHVAASGATERLNVAGQIRVFSDGVTFQGAPNRGGQSVSLPSNTHIDNATAGQIYFTGAGTGRIRSDGSLDFYSNAAVTISPTGGTTGLPTTTFATDGNVGIGTTTPAAKLDLTSTTSGLLIPRLTTAQRTAINPATAGLEGMQVYDTTTDEIFYIKGNAWTALGAAGAGAPPSGSAGGDLSGTYPNPAVAAGAITSAKISDGTIVNADINASAAIDASKINTGVVSNTEFNYLDGVTSAIQTQLNSKISLTALSAVAPLAYNNTTGVFSLPAATTAAAGHLTAADKTKLDGLEALAAGNGLMERFSGVLRANTCGTDGEVLKWNSVSGWTCGADLSGAANAFVQNGNVFGAAAILGTNDNNTLSFETNNSTKVTILTDGRVGIGDSTPGYLLTIGSPPSSGGSGFENYQSGAVANDSLRVVSDNSGASFGVMNSNSSGFSGIEYMNSSGTVTVFSGFNNSNNQEFRFNNIAAGGYLNFMAGGSTRLHVANNGLIGIGTTTPASILDVTSTTSGILIPRMTTAQRDAIGATGRTGMQIYNTTTNELNYHNGTAWTALGAAGAGAPPSGAAGGDLTGSYPNPTIAANTVTSAKIADSSIINADINASAAIDAAKINTGVVSNAEFNYLDGVTSAIQTQLDGKQATIANGAGNTVWGMNAAGTARENKALSATTPLVLTHGVGTMALTLDTVPVSKGGTGLTATANNSVLITNNLGVYENKQCATGKILQFDTVLGIQCVDLPSGGTSQWTTAGSDIYYSTGNVGIGTMAPGSKLEVVGGSSFINGNQIMYSNTGSAAFIYPKIFSRSRGTFAAPTSVVSGDDIGMIGFNAYNSGSYRASASIMVTADGAPGATNVPARITFSTATDSATSTERMRITSAGNVGVGTSAPSAKLEVNTNMRLTSATAPTWNDTGMAQKMFDIGVRGANPEDGIRLFVHDNTSGYVGWVGAIVSGNENVNGWAGKTMRFKTPDNGGNPLETMAMINGKVGIGAIAPNAKLEVFGTDAAAAVVRIKAPPAPSNSAFEIQDSGATPKIVMYASGTATFTGNVSAPAFISTSDRNLKSNIRIVRGLPLILQLSGVTFDWKESGKADMGVIAQEVEKVFPWSVVTDPKTGVKAVNYSSLVGPLIEATKDLDKKDLELGRKIASLEAENKVLKEKNTKMEQALLEIAKRLEALEKRK